MPPRTPERARGTTGRVGVLPPPVAVVPIVGSAPTDVSARAVAILVFVCTPTLYFWVNLTLFVRSLRRLVSAQGANNSHQLR